MLNIFFSSTEFVSLGNCLTAAFSQVTAG